MIAWGTVTSGATGTTVERHLFHQRTATQLVVYLIPGGGLRWFVVVCGSFGVSLTKAAAVAVVVACGHSAWTLLLSVDAFVSLRVAQQTPPSYRQLK